MKHQKMGEPIISDLDIFFCENCQRKLVLFNDQRVFRAREITLYCGHCKTTYTITITKV